MPETLDDFAALVADVARFYMRDRKLVAAQAAIAAALRAGEPSEPERHAYLAAVRAYFAGFEREATAHLIDVERRLEHASQVQFNLTAERGVAAKRVEVTRGVLAVLERLEHA